MKILILNWRSLKDPLEGGAERATFEFAKRWVKNFKSEVTWVAPRYNLKIKSEIIEGVKFDYISLPLKRDMLALLFLFPIFYVSIIFRYFFVYRGKVDIVIDQVHGIPFLTPLYVKEKIVVYIHEVAGEIWKLMYQFPINRIGKKLEIVILKLYKLLKINFVANSESTERDLCLSVGIDKKNIKIIYYGVTAPKTKFSELPEKEENLQIVYLNRIVQMKGIERGINAFKIVQNKIPKSKFIVIGKGKEDYLSKVKSLVKKLGLENSVVFVGFKDGEEKYDLLGRSHLLMNPSYLEGFGLVNIEANRMGTPAVVFDVRGCRDSVRNNISGAIVDDGDIKKMADKIIEIYKNEGLRKTSWMYSNNFDWDIQAEVFFKHIRKLVKGS